MFNETKGSINGKRNRRLFAWIKKKKKKKEDILIEEENKKELERKKKKIIGTIDASNINAQTVEENDFIIDKTEKINIETPPVISHEENIQIDVEQEQNIPVKTAQSLSIKQNDKGEKTNKINTINPTTQADDTKNKDATDCFKENSNEIRTDDKNKNFRKVNNQAELLGIIVNEINNILDEKQYDLKKLSFEFEVLIDKANDTVDSTEIDEIQKEIDKLLEKIKQIYKELELLTSSSAFQDVYKIQDTYLTSIIDEYISSETENKNVAEQVSQIESNKEYQGIINKIIEIDYEKDKLNKKLDDKKKYYQIRDDEFERWKEDYINVDDVTSYLKRMVEDSERILSDIDEKIRKSVTVTEIVETKVRNSLTLMGKALLFMSFLKKKPTINTPTFTAVSAFTAISLINDILKPKMVVTKKYQTDLIDYSDKINTAINNTGEVAQLIDNNISDIQVLKQKFQKNFSEYRNDISEYDDFMLKLNDIEKEMSRQKRVIEKTTHDLNNQYDKNIEKVKRYQNINA